jgi:catechol 2,3-dioxygenase-like lactoylglutathione lyase family enzyme
MKTLYFCLALLFWGAFWPAKASAQGPIWLDDIHYYVGDSATRQTANQFFIRQLGARAMAEQPINPLAFIDFLQIRPNQSTVNISSPGPFPGIRVGDPKRWQRERLESNKLTPPMYGVRWLALSTPNIRKSIAALKKAGIEFADQVKLPTDPSATAIAFWGFDYNLFVLVERKKEKGKTPYGIDHLQLLVNNLEDNIKFYEVVLGGVVLQKKERSAEMQIGNHRFILSEPEALGYERNLVLERNARKFLPNVDHLGFLYPQTEELIQHTDFLLSKGVPFLMKPTRMNYYDKPTPYTFCILMSPDGLQIELETEDGRTGPRTIAKK